ncbi:hypothetical protein R5O24_02805 [Tenacibaculum maritimum]|uniref:hypothetical protein n=1 Tax=Tenacibaculum maritimum TaxID=107401 RepID=UPI003890934A
MILFTTEISETNVLNAFNNNVVEYKSDSSLIPIKSVITILGEELEITPNPNGVFRYNFKEIVKKLINQNYFRDTIEPEIESSFVYLDDTVYKELLVEFKIEFEDESEETTSKAYMFLKSVEQLESFRKKLTNTENSSIALLTPFTDRSNKTYYSTYFEGYPFDISIYSNANRTITIHNKKINESTTMPLLKGVNRLFISDGNNNFSFEDELPLYFGINELEIRVSSTDYVTLFLKKVKSECGVYLKWFNNDGGWNYFLFKNYVENRKVKSIGLLDKNFDNLIDTEEPEIEMGKKSTDNISFFAPRIEEFEKKILNGVDESPKIYRYFNCMYQKSEKTDWIIERINSSKNELIDTKKKLYAVSIELNKTKRNTMTL